MNPSSMPGTLPYSSNAKNMHTHICALVCVYIIYVHNKHNTYDMLYIIVMFLKDFGYWGRELFYPAINPVSYSRDWPGKICQL